MTQLLYVDKVAYHSFRNTFSTLYFWMALIFCSFFWYFTLPSLLLWCSNRFSINNPYHFCFGSCFNEMRLWYLTMIFFIKSHNWSLLPFMIFGLNFGSLGNSLLELIATLIILSISWTIETKLWLSSKLFWHSFFFWIKLSRRIKNTHSFHIHGANSS